MGSVLLPCLPQLEKDPLSGQFVRQSGILLLDQSLTLGEKRADPMCALLVAIPFAGVANLPALTQQSKPTALHCIFEELHPQTQIVLPSVSAQGKRHVI